MFSYKILGFTYGEKELKQLGMPPNSSSRPLLFCKYKDYSHNRSCNEMPFLLLWKERKFCVISLLVKWKYSSLFWQKEIFIFHTENSRKWSIKLSQSHIVLEAFCTRPLMVFFVKIYDFCNWKVKWEGPSLTYAWIIFFTALHKQGNCWS